MGKMTNNGELTVGDTIGLVLACAFLLFVIIMAQISIAGDIRAQSKCELLGYEHGDKLGFLSREYVCYNYIPLEEASELAGLNE